MNKIGFMNKKGFTLIELLLAVSISTIVISLVSYALLQTLSQFSYTVDHSTLRQEASILAAEFEQAYLDLEGDNSYTVSMKNSNQLVIGDNTSTMDDYDLLIEVEANEGESFSLLSASECFSSCSGENICPPSSPGVEDTGEIYNQVQYSIRIHLFSKDTPCDTYEIVTNLSKV